MFIVPVSIVKRQTQYPEDFGACRLAFYWYPHMMAL